MLWREITGIPPAGIETFVTVSWATGILSFVTVSLPISSLGGKCDSLVALAE